MVEIDWTIWVPIERQSAQNRSRGQLNQNGVQELKFARLDGPSSGNLDRWHPLPTHNSRRLPATQQANPPMFLILRLFSGRSGLRRGVKFRQSATLADHGDFWDSLLDPSRPWPSSREFQPKPAPSWSNPLTRGAE